METKVCFKCGIEKPLSDYYKHKEMGDGHLNKCKDCTKKDTKDNIELKIKTDPDWYNKERKRNRDKYYRLGYKDKYKMPDFRNNSDYKSLSSKAKIYNVIHGDLEIHHWNYNLLFSVIILDRRTHRQLHQKMKLDKENLIYVTNDGVVLDTIEKHVDFINSIKEKVVYYDDIRKLFHKKK